MAEIHVTNYGEGSSTGVLRTVPFGLGGESTRILLDITPLDGGEDFNVEIVSDIPVAAEEVPESLSDALTLVSEIVGSPDFAAAWANRPDDVDEDDDDWLED